MEKEFPVSSFNFSDLAYPFLVVINTIRLRVPFLEKQSCAVPILKKESGEIGIEVPLDDKSIKGVPIKIFRLLFEIEGEKVPIEVNRELFEKYSEGEKMEIEYLAGSDRIHARIKKR